MAVKRILLVEDDPGLSELIDAALRSAEIEIVQADTKEKALQIIKDKKIDLLILDLNLPDGDGRTLLHEVKLPPTIVVTGVGDAETAVAVMKSGACDYLVKNSDFLEAVPIAVKRVCEKLETEARLRRAEEELKRTRKRLDLALENHSAGVMVVEGDELRITSLNRAARRLTEDVDGFGVGLSLYEMERRGYRWQNASGEEISVRDLGVAQAVREQRTVRDEIFRLVFPNGLQRWYASSATPILGGDSDTPAALCFVEDITERRRHEEEQRRLDVRLTQAQKLESMSVMAGGIAHDFNNLLMTMMGHADIALSEMAPMAPARENVVQIMSAARRAADLTRQMLIYTGKGRTVIEPINLQEMIEEMTHLLEVSISKKSHLRFQYAPDLPLIDGDPTQIRQVIMNLVINASEAIGDKSGIISVSTGVMHCVREYLAESYLDENLPEGPYVFIEIADTGCGMTKEVQQRVFEPFFTTKFQGRGLGMAAVLGIIRGHRGAIKIYSEPNKGTTFKILIPASTNHLDRRLKPQLPSDWRGSGRVLFVDDEESVRAVGQLMLEKLGFTVIAAENGIDGVERYRAEPASFDLVILDLIMPKMGGEEAFRELRRINPSVRVVMSSGYNESEVLPLFQGKGLVGFVQKPYSLVRLTEVLKPLFPAKS